MKKITLIFLSFLVFQTSHAQDSVSVEKSLIGGQIGYLGAWTNYEAKLSNRIGFKTEVGLEKRYLIHSFVPTNKSFHPIISVEPRYYYNLGRRAELLKKTRGNTGNFWALQVKYNLPFVIDNKTSSNNREAIIFTPKYGIRRTLGNHFNLETTLGFGYGYGFNTSLPGGFFSIEAAVRLGFHFGNKK
jgi:hypothetical protein